MNATGSNGRRTTMGLIQINPLYPQAETLLRSMVAARYVMPLLEEALLQESLRFTGAETSVRTAWALAYNGAGKAPALPDDAIVFGRQLLEACRALWRQPPFDHPGCIIYAARRYGYHGHTLAVEVTYREPLPPVPAHSSHAALA